MSATDDVSPTMKLLAAVGAALGAWSIVEIQLCALFYSIADMRSQDKARALFDGIISFEIRVGVVDRLMETEAVDAVEAEMWRRMSAKLTKCYKKRHQIAHFTVLNDPPEVTIAPFFTLTKMNTGTATNLTAKEVFERTQKFGDLTKALNWFQEQAVRRRWPGGETDLLQLREEPPLVLQLRALAIQTLEGRSRQQ